MSVATIQEHNLQAIPAFFQALARHVASTPRGQRALREKDEMLSDHRIVKVSIQSSHITCVARQDLPDYHISAGQTFHLFSSNYSDAEGSIYAYIVADGCSCKSYEFRHCCQHSKDASNYNIARYHAMKATEVLVDEVTDLPIVLVDADGEWALVLQNGQELTVRVSELDVQIGDFEEVYSLLDFEEAKAEATRFEREAYAILDKERAALGTPGHAVEETEFGAMLMRAS